MSETAQSIIDIAERMIRNGGYHSFSFRQIADELRIKSASIHYHFPTKEALGEAVVSRYTKKFLAILGEPEDYKDAIGHYIQAFQKSLKENKRACLCGVLAAESGKLPDSIREALTEFTEKNLKWLEAALKSEKSDWSAGKVRDTAAVIFSALEGAVIFAAMADEGAHLAKVGKILKAMVV